MSTGETSTRAKDPKIVTESQKVFRILKSVFLVITVILIGITILIAASKKKKETPSAKTPAVQGWQMPVCAEYDFSDHSVPGKIIIDYKVDCRSEITLPPHVVFRTDPSTDIKIRFIDGSQYIDGPKKRVWFGLKKGIFSVHGLNKAGTLKISIEAKADRA